MKKNDVLEIILCLIFIVISKALRPIEKNMGKLILISLSCFITGLISFGAENKAVAGNNAGAAFSVWPDTGQTKCYDNDSEISCPAEGEAFYGQDAQYQGPQRSYTKLGANGVELSDSATISEGWIMTRDNVTGLVWEIKTDDDGIHDKDNKYTWCDTNSDTNGGIQGTCGDGTDTEDFINDLNDNNFGGYSDWRLPTIKELSTLINSDVPYPELTIDTVYFPNTMPSYYFSSTAQSADLAWSVYFSYGYLGYYYKSDYNYVRAVRSAQDKLSDHLVDNHDGTITDTTTGLMWQKCSMGQTYNASTNGCDGSANYYYNWQQALAECENFELRGYDDWHLPSRNELQSIVDYSRSLPAIDPNYFPNTMLSSYWSSTTDASNTPYAWSVNFSYGAISYNYKNTTTNYTYVRAVRSAQDFDDVPLDFWAYAYISKLYASGITSGCGNGNFCPNQPVTRAQMAVFLERGIHGSNYNPPAATGIFNDVSTTYWAADWIEQLYSEGITSGCGNNNFCPKQPVTRAQMAVFLLRAKHGSNYNPPAATGIFNDVPTSYWAADWIEQLYSEGITSGCGNNNFCPKQPVTRAQMAVFLVRTFEL